MVSALRQLVEAMLHTIYNRSHSNKHPERDVRPGSKPGPVIGLLVHDVVVVVYVVVVNQDMPKLVCSSLKLNTRSDVRTSTECNA